MARLYLAANWISATEVYGHLQIVYSASPHSFLEVEVQAPDWYTIPFGGSFVFPEVRDHFDPGNTQGVGSADTYGIAEVILLDGQDVDGAWSLIQQVREQLSVVYANIDYNLNQNSNSFAATVFSVSGVNALAYLDQITPNLVTWGFPGANRNILESVAGGTTIASLDLVGGDGNDFVRTGSGDDDLAGGGGSDTLIGRSGEDELYGGAGDDFLFFDAADGPNVNGGADRDAAWLIGDDAVSFDMTANEIEVLVGGGGNDTLTAGDSSETLMIAGEVGSDVFNVSYGNGEGTRILWGGDGADSFQFTFSGGENSPNFQLGLLVANVAGLTAANFSTFTLSMLNLPSSFAWGAIDAVILNPGAGDQVSIDGYTLVTDPVVEEFYALTAITEEDYEYGLVLPYVNRPAIVGTSDYLGQTMLIQSPEGDGMSEVWYRRGENGYASLFNGQEVSHEELDDLLDELLVEFGSTYSTWDVDLSYYGGPEEGQGRGNAYYIAGDADGNYAPDEYDTWFIAGGKFANGALQSVNAPTATMDPEAGVPLEWLLA